MKKKEENLGSKRNIDRIIDSSTQDLRTSYSLISRMKVKSWKAYAALAFVAGFCFALIWVANHALYPHAEAADNVTTVYTLTADETHKKDDTFQTQVILDADSNDIVAVQAVATYDSAQVSITSVDTSASDFPNEAANQTDTGSHKILVAAGKPTPGVDSASAKIAVVNMKALKDFNGAGITLKFASADAVDDCAAILDDGKGTNVLAYATTKFTNPTPTPSSGVVPVYRFWSDKNNGHFYTATNEEKNYVVNNYPANIWKFEGIGYYTFIKSENGTVPVYRFWSDKLSGHFYTASSSEKDYVIAHYPTNVWKYEGAAFYVYGNNETNSVPIYRFWSNKLQHHFYTASSSEKDYVIAHYSDDVWHYEGIAWYAPEN
jgi:hypothetical protein